MRKIEQVVRLIRSKAVGVYFVSQNPLDIPDMVLGQLGNRVQHTLRAFTPRDQKAVAAVAETFRTNSKVDVETAITELGVGEALVSFLDEKGVPSPVERTFVCPPESRIGSITNAERTSVIEQSLVKGIYEASVDRESAHEKLKQRANETAKKPEDIGKKEEEERGFDWGDLLGKKKSDSKTESQSSSSVLMTAAKNLIEAASSPLGRRIIRGILGSIFKR